MEWVSVEWWVLLLAIPLIVGLFLSLMRLRQSVSEAFGGASVPRWRLGEWIRLVLVSLGWAGLTLGLMGPFYAIPTDQEGRVLEEELQDTGVVKSQERRRLAHDVIILIDSSASMQVRDTRTGDTRLGHAKEIAEALIEELQGENVALYAFTSQVSPLVPPTMDYFFARLMLRGMGINEGDIAGTDLVETLDFLKSRHLDKDPAQLKTVLLFSDGGDTRLEQVSGPALQQETEAILSRLGDPTESNLRLYTIGLGSAQGEVIPGIEFEGEPVRSSLDERLLSLLAKRGRGEYYFANGYSTLSIVEDLLAKARQEQTSYLETGRMKTGIKLRRLREGELLRDHLYFWPVGMAFLALVIALILPESLVRRGVVGLTLIPLFLSASIQSDFAEAEAFGGQGRYDEQIRTYQELLGQRLDEKQRLIIFYNLGRSYLFAEDYDEARLKFQQVMDASSASIELQKRAGVNLLHSLVRKADSLCDYRFERIQGFPEECQEALQLLETAYRLYPQIEEMEAQVSELAPLKELIRERLVWMREYARLHFLKMLEIKQGVELARHSMIERQQQIEELLLSNDDDPSREFLLITLEEQKNQELWRELRARFTDPDHREKQPLFLKAEGERLAALESLRPQVARQRLGIGAVALEGLILQLDEADLALALLERRVEQVSGLEGVSGKLKRWRQEDLSASEDLILALLTSAEPEDTHLRRVLDRLADQVRARSSALQDFILYRQLQKSETEVLLGLYEKGDADELEALAIRWELGDEKGAKALELLRSTEPATTQNEWKQLVLKLLKIWDPTAAFRLELQQLAQSYEGPVQQDKVGSATVGRLKIDTARVMAEIDTLDAQVQEMLTEPSQIVLLRLDQALRALQSGRPLHARAYVLDGMEWIHRMIHRISPPSNTPAEILKWGIQEAEHGVVLNTWIHLMQEKERLERSIADGLSSSQQLVPPSVEGFEQAAQQEPIPEEAMTLFKEGLEAAHQAIEPLNLRRPNFSDGLRYQQITLEKWEQALKLLEKDSPQNEGQGEEEPEPKEQPQSEEESRASAEELLRLLQQLENEDREEQNQREVEVKQGQRPW